MSYIDERRMHFEQFKFNWIKENMKDSQFYFYNVAEMNYEKGFLINTKIGLSDGLSALLGSDV